MNTPNFSQLPGNGYRPGQFFADFDCTALGRSGLRESTQDTMQWLFEEGNLERALLAVREMNDSGEPTCFIEGWRNSALNAFEQGSVVVDGFSDSTSGATAQGETRERHREDYVVPSAHTYDPRFPNMQLRDCIVGSKALAVAVVDPTLLEVTEADRELLRGESEAVLRAYIAKQKPRAFGMGLRDVVGQTLVGKGFVAELDEHGNQVLWPLPFDEISILKGLEVVLGTESHSGFVRQGAVQVCNESTDHRAIVGVSGGRSEFDALGADSIAWKIAYGTTHGHIQNVHP